MILELNVIYSGFASFYLNVVIRSRWENQIRHIPISFGAKCLNRTMVDEECDMMCVSFDEKRGSGNCSKIM